MTFSQLTCLIFSYLFLFAGGMAIGFIFNDDDAPDIIGTVFWVTALAVFALIYGAFA